MLFLQSYPNRLSNLLAEVLHAFSYVLNCSFSGMSRIDNLTIYILSKNVCFSPHVLSKDSYLATSIIYEFSYFSNSILNEHYCSFICFYIYGEQLTKDRL